MQSLFWVAVVVVFVAVGYGLHRLGLFLEKRDLIYYRRRPATGGGYNPLQEFVQPNYRNVVEVAEQRTADDEEGSPKDPGQ